MVDIGRPTIGGHVTNVGRQGHIELDKMLTGREILPRNHSLKDDPGGPAARASQPFDANGTAIRPLRDDLLELACR